MNVKIINNDLKDFMINMASGMGAHYVFKCTWIYFQSYNVKYAESTDRHSNYCGSELLWSSTNVQNDSLKTPELFIVLWKHKFG